MLARVIPAGPACHTGTATCFGPEDAAHASDVLGRLDQLIADRAATSADESISYTHRLLRDRNLRLKKLGEECAELVMACTEGDRGRAAEEGADLLYHTLVALRAVGISLEDLCVELARRGKS